MTKCAEDMFGFHESGACVPVVNMQGKAYVAVLVSAPVKQKDGSYWGTVDIGDGQQLAYLDIPGGKTRQFENKDFVKEFFLSGGQRDPWDARLREDYKHFESGLMAAIRERDEETHNIFRSCPGLYDIYKTGGGYKAGSYVTSIVTVAFEMIDLKRCAVQDQGFFTALRATFTKHNDALFRSYEEWKRMHPNASESEQWDKRPEFMDMTFVTSQSFATGLEKADEQLKKYSKKETTHKGVAVEFTDYMGRSFFAAFRSWPVYILWRSGVWDKMQRKHSFI